MISRSVSLIDNFGRLIAQPYSKIRNFATSVCEQTSFLKHSVCLFIQYCKKEIRSQYIVITGYNVFGGYKLKLFITPVIIPPLFLRVHEVFFGFKTFSFRTGFIFSPQIEAVSTSGITCEVENIKKVLIYVFHVIHVFHP